MALDSPVKHQLVASINLQIQTEYSPLQHSGLDSSLTQPHQIRSPALVTTSGLPFEDCEVPLVIHGVVCQWLRVLQ